MNLGFPAQERPARKVLIAVSHCAKIMPSRVQRASRFSVRPAVSYIERSTQNLYQQTTGEFGNEEELRIRLPRNGPLVRLPSQFHFLHLFICHRHCIWRPPRFSLIEILFRMAEISKTENVGTE